jgi:hypothetical protein
MKKALVALLLAFGLGGIAFSVQADPVPPPLRYDPPPPAYVPPGHVWQEGYWRWDGYRHVWVEGHWVRRDEGFPIARLWDRDMDGVANAYDRDADGDGVPNRFDRFPYNPYRS